MKKIKNNKLNNSILEEDNRMETQIYDMVVECCAKYNFHVSRNFTPSWCTNEKTNRQMELDIYVAKAGLAIECQSEYHYVQTSYGEDVGVTKSRDVEKIRRCNENNITLLHGMVNNDRNIPLNTVSYNTIASLSKLREAVENHLANLGEEYKKKDNRVYTTMGYEELKNLSLVCGNRPIDNKRVSEIEKAIEERGNAKFLGHITIDSIMQAIIDAQHRWKAELNCYEKGILDKENDKVDVCIEYCRDKNEALNKMLRLNNTSKNWSPTNFLLFFASNGNNSYSLLKTFCEDNKMVSKNGEYGCSTGQIYLMGYRGKKRFETGHIKIIQKDVECAQEMYNTVNKMLKVFDMTSLSGDNLHKLLRAIHSYKNKISENILDAINFAISKWDEKRIDSEKAKLVDAKSKDWEILLTLMHNAYLMARESK